MERPPGELVAQKDESAADGRPQGQTQQPSPVRGSQFLHLGDHVRDDLDVAGAELPGPEVVGTVGVSQVEGVKSISLELPSGLLNL